MAGGGFEVCALARLEGVCAKPRSANAMTHRALKGIVV
jgi:hypothetical protein